MVNTIVCQDFCQTKLNSLKNDLLSWFSSDGYMKRPCSLMVYGTQESEACFRILAFPFGRGVVASSLFFLTLPCFFFSICKMGTIVHLCKMVFVRVNDLIHIRYLDISLCFAQTKCSINLVKIWQVWKSPMEKIKSPIFHDSQNQLNSIWLSVLPYSFFNLFESILFIQMFIPLLNLTCYCTYLYYLNYL